MKTDHQKIFDRLCNSLRVPCLEVVIVDKLADEYAYFSPDEYIVYIEKSADKKHLVHEFCHYLVHLLSRVEAIEEDVCDNYRDSKTEFLMMNDPELKNLLKTVNKRKTRS